MKTFALFLFLIPVTSLLAQIEYIQWKGDYVLGGASPEHVGFEYLEDTFSKDDSIDRMLRIPLNFEKPLNPELLGNDEMGGVFYGQIQVNVIDPHKKNNGGEDDKWVKLALYDKGADDVLGFYCNSNTNPKDARGAGLLMWNSEDSITGEKIQFKELDELVVDTEIAKGANIRCVIQSGDRFFITDKNNLNSNGKFTISLGNIQWFRYLPDLDGSVDVRDINIYEDKKILGNRIKMDNRLSVDRVGIYFDTNDADNATVAFREITITQL